MRFGLLRLQQYYRLVQLALTLPVVTDTVERSIFAMAHRISWMSSTISEHRLPVQWK